MVILTKIILLILWSIDSAYSLNILGERGFEFECPERKKEPAWIPPTYVGPPQTNFFDDEISSSVDDCRQQEEIMPSNDCVDEKQHLLRQLRHLTRQEDHVSERLEKLEDAEEKGTTKSCSSIQSNYCVKITYKCWRKSTKNSSWQNFRKNLKNKRMSIFFSTVQSSSFPLRK